MTRKQLDFDTVQEIALGFPGVEASTSYGVASVKANGKLMACPAINKSAEPGSIVVKIDVHEREQLIALHPDVYYLTDHYRPYPSVLVRLAKIDRKSLQALLKKSWEFITAGKNKR